MTSVQDTQQPLFVLFDYFLSHKSGGYLGTLLYVLFTLGTSQKACVGDSFGINLYLCAVKEDIIKIKACQ